MDPLGASEQGVGGIQSPGFWGASELKGGGFKQGASLVECRGLTYFESGSWEGSGSLGASELKGGGVLEETLGRPQCSGSTGLLKRYILQPFEMACSTKIKGTSPFTRQCSGV